MQYYEENYYMHTSENGIALIKRFEGCCLTAYKDRVGVWTIGWGTTNADKSITGRTLKRGMKISQRTADDWLRKSLAKKYEPLVAKYDDIYHWRQNEFDALVSFCYNIGSIDKLTANGTRTRAEVEAAILLYDKAGGKRVKGLTERRIAEQKLFHSLVEGVTSKATAKKTTPKTPFKVKVASPNLNVRSGPGTDHFKTGLFTGPGVFTIVEVRSGTGSKSGWGRLLSGVGWISMDYCETV
jgi:GH24 family phage-related lysozyme (muramidase)